MTKEKIRLNYYECNMTKIQHITAYLMFAALIAGILFIYYRSFPVSIIGGLVLSVFQERIYAASTISKRQNKLRLQFKDFLEIITISVSGGGGRTFENAIRDSLKELRLLFNENADIVREIELIIGDYEMGRPIPDSFMELGKRSDIEDIRSFATVIATIDGASSDFGYVIRQTHDIIKEKTEIVMEIETSSSSAKSEAYTMLVMPLIIVIAMSTMGSGFMDALFTTKEGKIAATVGVASMLIAYVLAQRATRIDV